MQCHLASLVPVTVVVVVVEAVLLSRELLAREQLLRSATDDGVELVPLVAGHVISTRRSRDAVRCSACDVVKVSTLTDETRVQF